VILELLAIYLKALKFANVVQCYIMIHHKNPEKQSTYSLGLVIFIAERFHFIHLI